MEQESVTCGMLIKQINSELEKEANNSLRQDNLTLSQITVLVELNRAPEGKMDMKQMEKKVHVAQSTLAGIAFRLEEKGFIMSMGSERDRRIKVIQITDEGKKCCEKAKTRAQEAEDRLLGSLTETERGILISLLSKVRASFG